MDAASLEVVFDPSKCSKLSVDQKRELVYEISKWSDAATEILHAWSRQEILEILCAELGKERKYTGLTKSKIIEHLLKIVYEKKPHESITENVSLRLENDERTAKRQKKTENGVDLSDNTVYCKNSACKAKMNRGDVFCKRCSCCICRRYDDNKDPSLWLICNSDPPFHGVSCGISCHLECALKHEKTGILKDKKDKGLDGSFCCVSCGKVNDLLWSWRKQLLVARDTRRVDILCYRLSLAHKILSGTKHYQNLSELIDEAIEKLEEEMGPLTGLPVKKARGIVNRLSLGPEIQRVCAYAVESLDSMLSKRLLDTPSDCKGLESKLVRFEDIRASSLTIILNSDCLSSGNVVSYTLWHRKSNDMAYPSEPTCRLFEPNKKFVLSGLNPETLYFLKVITTLGTDKETGFYEFQFRTGNSQNEAKITNSSLSNPSSVEDETNNDKNAPANLLNDTIGNKDSSNGHIVDETSNGNLQISPSKLDNLKNSPVRKSRRKSSGKGIDVISKEGSSSKKRIERRDEDCNGIENNDLEYYVKVIRRLECDGYVDSTFRQRFLTWYGLRATREEIRVVKVFVDTFIEDSESLAGQLVDTFSDVISDKRRCCKVPSGFCLKLWH